MEGIPASSVMALPFRQNGVRMVNVTVWKNGPIQLKDGSTGFGLLYRKTLKEESRMLTPRKEIKGQPAVVSIGRGLTIGMGDYEFCRIDEFISMPCNATAEEVEQTRLDVRKDVEQHIEAERVRIKGTMPEKVAYVKAGMLRLTDFDSETAAQIEAHIKPA